jgi:hypothetical protein
LAALDAVEVVGPTNPESCAVQHLDNIEIAVATMERILKSFMIEI